MSSTGPAPSMLPRRAPGESLESALMHLMAEHRAADDRGFRGVEPVCAQIRTEPGNVLAVSIPALNVTLVTGTAPIPPRTLARQRRAASMRAAAVGAALVIGLAAVRQLVRQRVAGRPIQFQHGDDGGGVRSGPKHDEPAGTPGTDLKLPSGGEGSRLDGGGVERGIHARSPDRWVPVYTNRPTWYVTFAFGGPDAQPVYAGRWDGPDPFQLNIPRVGDE